MSAPVGRAERATRLDELLLLQRQHLAAHDAGHGHPRHDDEQDDREPDRRRVAEDRSEPRPASAGSWRMTSRATRSGKARNRSVSASGCRRALPPLKPAKAPTIVPMMADETATAMPMKSEMRPPQRMREYMSRPIESVPNQQADCGRQEDGTSVRGSPTASVSPYGAIHGARMTARRDDQLSTMALTTAARWRRKRRTASWNGDREAVAMPSAASAVSAAMGSGDGSSADSETSLKADPRVEHGVEHVGEQVEEDHRDHDDDHPRHQLREVAVARGRSGRSRPSPCTRRCAR